MFKLSEIKKPFILLTIMTMLIIPNLAIAGHGGMGGMGGMGGCCGGTGIYGYGGYYPSTNTAAWRTGSLLGYPSGLLGGGLYSPYLGGLGGYALGGYGGISPYLGGLGGYALGGYGGYPLGGLGGLGLGYPSSSSTEYSVTQKNTLYGPTGGVTSSLSQSQEYFTYPWANYGLGGLGLGGLSYGYPFSYGLGGWV